MPFLRQYFDVLYAIYASSSLPRWFRALPKRNIFECVLGCFLGDVLLFCTQFRLPQAVPGGSELSLNEIYKSVFYTVSYAISNSSSRPRWFKVRNIEFKVGTKKVSNNARLYSISNRFCVIKKKHFNYKVFCNYIFVIFCLKCC